MQWQSHILVTSLPRKAGYKATRLSIYIRTFTARLSVNKLCRVTVNESTLNDRIKHPSVSKWQLLAESLTKAQHNHEMLVTKLHQKVQIIDISTRKASGRCGNISHLKTFILLLEMELHYSTKVGNVAKLHIISRNYPGQNINNYQIVKVFEEACTIFEMSTHVYIISI